MIVLDRDLIVYRGHGGDTGPVGRFTTPTYPLDRLDMRQSMAILEEWGNSLTEITTFRIPAGTTIYQGLAERQGNLPGWGLQTFIPDIRPEWIILTEPLQ